MASRLKLFLPLFLFAILGMFLLRGLSLDPREMPSALIDKPFPQFELSDLRSGEMRQRDSILGRVSLVNVWATWCISCRVEHPYLKALADKGVVIHGLNYKDQDSAALRWLKELGNPYQVSLADRDGTLGLDLGVYGAPETYLVDAQGIVRYRHVGIVNEEIWHSILEPLYTELQAASMR